MPSPSLVAEQASLTLRATPPSDSRPAPHWLLWWRLLLGSRALPAVPTLLAGTLTLPFVNRSPLWADEVDSVSAATRSLPDLWRLLSHQDGPLAGYYLLLHVWTAAFGTSPVAVRLPSVAALLVSVWLTTRLGDLLGGRGVGLLAGLLLASNPFALSFGLDARPYAFALAAAAGSGLLLAGPSAPAARQRLTFGLVVMLGVLAHLFFLLALTAQLLGLRLARRPLLPWLLPCVVAGILVAPLVLLCLGQTAEVGYLHRPGPLSLPGWFQAIAGGSPLLSVPAGLILLLSRQDTSAGRWTIATEANRRLLLAWLCLPGPLLLLISSAHPLYLNRYVVESVPALTLLLAMCLVRAAPRRVAIGAAAVLLVAAIGTSAGTQSAPFRYENLQSAADTMLDSAAPRDGAVYPPSTARTALTYYVQREDPGAAVPDDILQGVREAQAGNFGGVDVPADVAVRQVLKRPVVWLLRYADPSSQRGATALAVLKALHDCYTPGPVQRFGQVLVQRQVTRHSCSLPGQRAARDLHRPGSPELSWSRWSPPGPGSG